MSNRELLDMVRFGWIARIWLGCLRCQDVRILPQNCTNTRILLKIAEYCLNCPSARMLPKYRLNCTKYQNIAQNTRILHKCSGHAHPEYGSFNHCHHPTPYSQQKRVAYSASTFSTPIILFFVASRSCLVSCQSDSVIVAICSLKSHRSRF